MATAANILIRLGMDVASLREGMAVANKQLEGFGAGVNKVAGLLKGAVALFAVDQIAQYASRLLDTAGGFSELAESMGVGVVAFQAWSLALGEAGVGSTELQKALQTLSKNVNEARDGSKEAISRFKELGVNILDVRGKVKPTEEILRLVADALLKMDDPTKRTALALELLGKAGARSIPALKDLATDVDTLAARFGRGIIPEETVRQIDEFTDRMKTNGKIFEAVLVNEGWRIFQALLKGTEGAMSTLRVAWDDLAFAISSFNSSNGNFLSFIGQKFLEQAVIWIQGVALVFNAMSDLIFFFDTIKPRIDIIYGSFLEFWGRASQGWTDFSNNVRTYFGNALNDVLAQLSDFVRRGAEIAKYAPGIGPLFGLLTRIPDLEYRIKITTVINDEAGVLIGQGQSIQDAARRQLEAARLNQMLGGPKYTDGIGAPVIPRLPDNSGRLPPPAPGAGAKGLSEAEKALQAYNKELDASYQKYTDMLDPMNRYFRMLHEVDELLIAGRITGEQHSAIYAKIREEMDKTAAKASPFADSMKEIFRAIDSYGKKIADNFIDLISGAMTLSTANVRQAVADMIRELAKLVFYQTVIRPLTHYVSGALATWMGIPSLAPRAAGGPTYPGQSYLVGEFGPERFTPTVPGTIEHTGRSEGWGGGDTNVSIGISGVGTGSGADTSDAMEFARRLRSAVLDVIRTEKRPGGLLAS